MTTFSFLLDLRAKDIYVWVREGRLNYSAPVGSVSAELKAELTRRRLEIIALLERNADLGVSRIERVDDAGDPPLSFQQERLWFLDRLSPGLAVYNIPLAFHLRGEIDAERLERSLRAVVKRHEVLRTRFVEREGRLVQEVGPVPDAILAFVDLEDGPEAERRDETRRHLSAAAEEAFDLSTGPLMRASLLRLEASDHVLLLVLHHAVFDGWSIGVLTREISAQYAAQGDAAAPRGPEIRYRDYARWQREHLTGERIERQVAYWREKLEGVAPLNLPSDRMRPPRQNYDGAVTYADLPADVSAGIRDLARREGATLFMVLLAAFKTLLYRYASQEDIAVGTPVAGRGRPELDDVIGFFINTLVLRSCVRGTSSFCELLGHVREVAVGALENQDVPFEQIVTALQPERDLSRSPLFQVMFSYHAPQREALRLGEVAGRRVTVETRTSKFGIGLSVRENDAGRLRTRWTYDTALFDADRIDRMAAHFRVLLEGIVEDPDRPIDQLPLMTDTERTQLLLKWNRTEADYPLEACIHELFERQAAQNQEATALIYAGERLSYGELDRRADDLANHLVRLGVGPDVVVGLCLERSFEMVVGMLGILKAGGAYLPLDPAYPQDRLRFMLEDAAAPVLVTRRRIAERLQVEHGCTVVAVDEPYVDAPRPLRGTRVRSTNVAYVIYTSGSTGQPKGVRGTHRGAVNRIHWMWDRYPFEPDEVCCHKTALSFVDSVWEVFGPLLGGVPLVLIPDDVVKDPQRFVECLAEYAVTRLILVPSLLATLLDAVPILDGTLPHLHYWTSSGETLTEALAARFHERLPGRVLLNLYGSSEVSADVTWHEVKDGEASRHVPIGRPIANTRIYIVDATLNPVPIGVPGELLVGGDGLADGYVNRPALTSEKFIEDPFRPDARVYRTGDLGRYRPDGTIEFVGRLDDQVKIRGFRVEPGEVAVVLRRYPGVREAVVVARVDQGRGTFLTAYVLPAADTAIDLEALRQDLRSVLPEYLLPSQIISVERLPKNPNGKIDRQALPDPKDMPKDAGDEPSTPVEETLLHIWRDVLGSERIGVNDNFFDMGGHSLLAVGLVSRINDALKIDAPLTALFDAPSARKMARALGTVRTCDASIVRCAINRDGSSPPFFCIPPFSDLGRHLSPETPFYGLANDLRDDHLPVSSVRERALYFVNEIVRIEPRGPYLLGAFCAHAPLAAEIARRLEEEGKEVPLMVLFEPSPLPFVRSPSRWATRLRRLRYLSPYQQFRYVAVGVPRSIGRLYKKLTRKMPYHFIDRSMRANARDRLQARNESWRRQAFSYVPKTFSGRLALIWSEDRLHVEGHDTFLGWDTVAPGRVDVRITPGGHESMMREPFAARLADVVQNLLNEHHVPGYRRNVA